MKKFSGGILENYLLIATVLLIYIPFIEANASENFTQCLSSPCQRSSQDGIVPAPNACRVTDNHDIWHDTLEHCSCRETIKIGCDNSECVGRCGPGCGAGGGGIYTKDCAEHDRCCGLHGGCKNPYDGDCGDEWTEAKDDFLFGNLYGNGSCQGCLWAKNKEYPGTITADGNPNSLRVFSIEDKGYVLDASWIGLPQPQPGQIWEYKADKDKWTRKNDHPGIESRYPYFVIKDEAFFISRGNQLWRYTPGNDSWKRMRNIPGNDKLAGFGFSIGKKGYIGGGFYNGQAFWEYDVKQNTWKQLDNHPMISSIVCNQGYNCDIDGITFSIGNKGYVTGTNMNFFEYNQDTRQWKKRDYVDAVSGAAFAIDKNGYVYNAHGDLYEYLSEYKAWRLASQLPTGKKYFCYPGSFSIKNKGYIGVGNVMENNNCTLKGHRGLWKYTVP